MKSSHEPPKVSLRLTLNYSVPSLNVTKRRHWAQQYKEKCEAFLALLCALSDSGSGRSTPTTSPADLLDGLRHAALIPGDEP